MLKIEIHLEYLASGRPNDVKQWPVGSLVCSVPLFTIFLK